MIGFPVCVGEASGVSVLRVTRVRVLEGRLCKREQPQRRLGSAHVPNNLVVPVTESHLHNVVWRYRVGFVPQRPANVEARLLPSVERIGICRLLPAQKPWRRVAVLR
jgi:hypothetical protein